jgi:hypothetical protein
MADITEVSAIVVAAGVLVGVVYYILDMRNQTRIRKTDLLARLYGTGTSSEFMDAFFKISNLQFKDYSDYVRQYGPLSDYGNPMNRAFFMVVYYYDMAGTLLYRKLIDPVTVYDTWGSSNPISLFEKLKPIMIELRKEYDEPLAFVGFEYLVDELKRRESQLRKTWGKYTSQNSPNSQQRGVKSG